MQQFKYTLLLLGLFFSLAYAQDNPESIALYYPALAPSFNINHYAICQALIRQCPPDGLFPKESCATQLLNTNRSCKPLQELVHILDISPSQIVVKQIKNITLIDMLFPADGQDNYYFLSHGVLINSNTDPRLLNTNLANKYKNTEFFTVNWGEPSYHFNQDGSQTFTVLLRVTNTCLACSVIGWATLNFNFTQQGQFLNVQLISFKQEM